MIDTLEVSVYKDRLKENVTRLRNLLQIFRDHQAPEDVLRAIVVFTYAFLEDFLRMAEGILLPERGETVINTIP